MSERDTGLGHSRPPGPGGDNERKEAAKSFFALVVCVVGILLGLVGLANPFFTRPATTLDVSIQAVGIFWEPCLLLFGAHRLAIAAVGLCIVAIFFGLATGQDLIPGIQGEDHTSPPPSPTPGDPTPEDGPGRKRSFGPLYCEGRGTVFGRNTTTEPPQPSHSPEGHPARGRGRNLTIAGIVSGAVSFLVIPILFGPLGVLLGILGLAIAERRLGTIAIGVSVLGLVVGFILSFLVLYLAEV